MIQKKIVVGDIKSKENNLMSLWI